MTGQAADPDTEPLICEDCGASQPWEDDEPNRCDHGRVICPTCWPSWCHDCADNASDLADADYCDAMWGEPR